MAYKQGLLSRLLPDVCDRMDQDVQHTACEVKARIATDAVQGSGFLMDFAGTYAVTAMLRHTALILKLNYTKATDIPDKERLQSQMLALVDEIVKDYQAHAHSETARQAQEARKQVEAHFRQVSPPRDVVFACEGLGKTYKKSRFSLKNVTLTLRLGEITGVVGENANGKTTLFRLIAGELRHDAGSMAFPALQGDDDRPIDWIEVKEHLAYVPQELPRWYGPLQENLQYEAALHSMLGEDNEREVMYIIERLDLAEQLDKRWTELSGGYKLRFSLARALVWKPKLLVLDEPLGNLDFKAQQVILQDLRDLANSLRYPMAVLISSQHLHELEAVADNILFLRQGEVTYNGPITELCEARQYNTFELDCSLDLHVLRERLQGFPYHRLYHNGLSYVITTPLHLGYRELLQRLLAAEVEIEYFRDISRSIKQLFS